MLAGDAAHDNSPLGGQGMNTGIGAAVALGAALDAALERDGPGALDAYAAARRPIAQRVVAVTNLLTRLALMDRQLRALRNVVLRALDPVAGPRLAWQLSGLAYRQRRVAVAPPEGMDRELQIKPHGAHEKGTRTAPS